MLNKIFSIVFFAVVSVVFVPMIAMVHVFYGPWEKWFESITKS